MQSNQEQRITRRGLIKSAAGLAALGAVVAVPALVFRPAADPDQSWSAGQESLLSTSGEPLVAYIKDAATGEVVIMTGIDEIVVTDPGLVNRLLIAGRL